MTREDLFLAIGEVEETRLLRSELAAPSGATEELHMKQKNRAPRRLGRKLLIAAAIASMLAVTACAVAGYILYDSPEAMISAIFGNKTGFDHSEGSIRKDPWGGPEGILVEPTYDRVEADPTLVAEAVAPHVDIVGRSITWEGYTLTVDSFLYDSATRCGFFTYLLENPDGVTGYSLQENGEIWYDGRPDIVSINQYGYAYIIQDKTTPTCLAAACYFKWDPRRGENLTVGFDSGSKYTGQDLMALLEAEKAALKAAMPEAEALERAKAAMGEEHFGWLEQELSREELVDTCYERLAADAMQQKLDSEAAGTQISVACEQLESLDHITLAGGNAVISSISLRMDIRDMEFLRRDSQDTHPVNTDAIHSIVIRYLDGTEYTVTQDYTVNYAFYCSEYPEENVQKEIIVTPEEDPAGEGYATVENTHDRWIATLMFNRIIDISQVDCLLLNGVELTVDK